MEQQVILKSNRYGINLILNENLPFEELLDAINYNTDRVDY